MLRMACMMLATLDFCNVFLIKYVESMEPIYIYMAGWVMILGILMMHGKCLMKCLWKVSLLSTLGLFYVWYSLEEIMYSDHH